jgi:hypothetical protein
MIGVCFRPENTNAIGVAGEERLGRSNVEIAIIDVRLTFREVGVPAVWHGWSDPIAEDTNAYHPLRAIRG